MKKLTLFFVSFLFFGIFSDVHACINDFDTVAFEEEWMEQYGTSNSKETYHIFSQYYFAFGTLAFIIWIIGNSIISQKKYRISFSFGWLFFSPFIPFILSPVKLPPEFFITFISDIIDIFTHWEGILIVLLPAIFLIFWGFYLTFRKRGTKDINTFLKKSSLYILAVSFCIASFSFLLGVLVLSGFFMRIFLGLSAVSGYIFFVSGLIFLFTVLQNKFSFFKK